MRPVPTPALTDDLPLDELIQGLVRESAILKKKPAGTNITFGKVSLPAEVYALALDYVAELAVQRQNKVDFLGSLSKEFEFLEVYGGQKWGDVLITSYYEPELKGSLTKTNAFSQPLYRTPLDLVEVAFTKDERFNEFGQMRGRIAKDRTARGTPLLVPYYSREEIDGKGVLKNRALELCWVDPIDAFFLHIQGSGTVVLPTGKYLRLGYADQNGHPYQPIGRYVTDSIPLEKLSMWNLETHLRGLPPEKIREILNRNPSYIFFDKRDGPALTSVGTPVIAGRTIATDARYFPKGALAFMFFEKPVFLSETEREPASWEPTGRLVLDQDTGGAIKGGGRLDLFWGYGNAAKQSAGVIKQTGKLYYLIPNPALVARLSANPRRGG